MVGGEKYGCDDGALVVKKDDDVMMEEGIAVGQTGVVQGEEKLEESISKNLKENNDGVSSYEASEDDSGSTNHFSPNTSINEVSQLSGNKNGNNYYRSKRHLNEKKRKKEKKKKKKKRCLSC